MIFGGTIEHSEPAALKQLAFLPCTRSVLINFCDKPLAVWTLICYDRDNRL